jgi:hypothetical protein
VPNQALPPGDRFGPRGDRTRETIFWLSALALAVLIVVLDRTLFFVYFPRWTFALPVALLLFPSRVNATYWVRAMVSVLLIALPYLIAPVRWNLLDSFYTDCAAIEDGSDLSEVRRMMQPYHLQRVAEGGARRAQDPLAGPHRTFHPDRSHSADWCVVAFDGTKVTGAFEFPD